MIRCGGTDTGNRARNPPIPDNGHVFPVLIDRCSFLLIFVSPYSTVLKSHAVMFNKIRVSQPSQQVSTSSLCVFVWKTTPNTSFPDYNYCGRLVGAPPTLLL